MLYNRTEHNQGTWLCSVHYCVILCSLLCSLLCYIVFSVLFIIVLYCVLYLLNGIFVIRFQGAKVWNGISGNLKLLSLKCFNTKVKSILIAKHQL